MNRIDIDNQVEMDTLEEPSFSPEQGLGQRLISPVEPATALHADATVSTGTSALLMTTRPKPESSIRRMRGMRSRIPRTWMAS